MAMGSSASVGGASKTSKDPEVLTQMDVLRRSRDNAANFCITIGIDPPWWLGVIMHDRQEKKYKCKTHIVVTTLPFRKTMHHNLRTLNDCKVTRPAAGHWQDIMYVGPFPTRQETLSIGKRWKKSKRGEYGRHFYGIQYVMEEYKRETGMELLCFSSLVIEDIPVDMLMKVPQESLTPFKSNPLTREQAVQYAREFQAQKSRSKRKKPEK